MGMSEGLPCGIGVRAKLLTFESYFGRVLFIIALGMSTYDLENDLEIVFEACIRVGLVYASSY